MFHLNDPETIRSRFFAVTLLLALCLVGCTPKPEITYQYIAFPSTNPDLSCYAISEANGSGETVEVPAQYNDLPVTVILDRAFHSVNAKKIVLSTILRIEKEAFLNMTRLEEIDLGSVKTIGIHAFSSCYSLKTITIPASVTELGGGAFYNCMELQKVYFEGVPEKIGSEVFQKDLQWEEAYPITIYGQPDTIIEEYALQYGYEFVDISTIQTQS